ncbi:MAG: hypothetical protein ACI4TS_03370 [Bacteroidaceae bacterium]
MSLLPVSMVVGIVFWIVAAGISLVDCGALALLLVTTFALRYFSNAIQLIRVRSWIVSSLFVFMMGVGRCCFGWSTGDVAATSLFLIYIIGLLSSYQSRAPQTGVFVAALALAILTVIMPLMVCLLPMCFIAMLTALRVLNLKTLSAVLFGFMAVAEVLFAWHLYADDMEDVANSFAEGMQAFCLPTDEGGIVGVFMADNGVAWPRLVGLLMIVVYGLIGIVHFVYTSFNDKISTRMHYITLILHWPVLFLLLVFTGGHAMMLSAILLLVNSVLLGHYFVFSKGWPANLLFWLFLLLCCCLALPL